MNRNQAKELLPFIQAFAEGKTIQSRCVKGDTSLWYNDEDPSFDDDFEYRINPETKYRPFRNKEECWQEMQKHQPFAWVKEKHSDRYNLITGVNGLSIKIKERYLFADGIKYYTFADGTPFGVKEEE